MTRHTRGTIVSILPFILTPFNAGPQAADWQTLQVAFSTFVGGSDYDSANAVTVDRSGVAWSVGTICSQDLATTPDALQPGSAGICDGFIQALNPDGTLRYLTYLGGAGQDAIYAMARDAQDNLYVAGRSQSRNLPVTSGAYQTTGDGSAGDGFVFKLTSDATQIIWGTYLGGSNSDWIFGIAVDSSGNVHVAGLTYSPDFPQVPATDRTTGDHGDAFYARLSSDGSTLLASIVLGGAYVDSATGIAVDDADNAYVVGWTDSPDFPSSPAPTLGLGGGPNNNGFIARIGADGPVYIRPFGGTMGTVIEAITVSPSSVFISGVSCSDNYTPTPSDPTKCTRAGFIARLQPSDGALGRIIFFDDSGVGSIAVDASDRAYVAGGTVSRVFPVTPDAAQPTWTGESATGFFAVVPMGDADPETPLYATYLGGASGQTDTYGVAIAPDGGAYVVGETGAPDFPLMSAWRSTFQMTEGFVVHYTPPGVSSGGSDPGVRSMGATAR